MISLIGSWRTKKLSPVVVAADLSGTATEVVIARATRGHISHVILARSNRIRPADRAWLALAIGVAGYEMFARDGELMSHSYDRWLVHRPVFTWAVTLITAAHLLNLLPDRWDPYNFVFAAWRRRA